MMMIVGDDKSLIQRHSIDYFRLRWEGGTEIAKSVLQRPFVFEYALKLKPECMKIFLFILHLLKPLIFIL